MAALGYASQRSTGLPIKRVPEFIDDLGHLEVFGRNPSCRMRDKAYRNFVVGNIQVRINSTQTVQQKAGERCDGRSRRHDSKSTGIIAPLLRRPSHGAAKLSASLTGDLRLYPARPDSRSAQSGA